MNLKSKVEYRLNDFLDELDSLEDMGELLLLKAKIECLRLIAETLSKLKASGEGHTEFVLPNFEDQA